MSVDITAGLIEIVISETNMGCIPPPVNTQQYTNLRLFAEKNNKRLNCSCLSIWIDIMQTQGTVFHTECEFNTPTTDAGGASSSGDAGDASSSSSSGSQSTASSITTAMGEESSSEKSTGIYATSTQSDNATTSVEGGDGVSPSQHIMIYVGLGVGVALGVGGVAGIAYFTNSRAAVGGRGVCYRATNCPSLLRRCSESNRIYTGDLTELPLQVINHTYDESEL